MKQEKRYMSLEQAKKEYDLFMGSLLFADIDTIIDCIGMGFDEWLEQSDISIET